MPPIRIKPEQLSAYTRIAILVAFEQILGDMGHLGQPINGVQITVDGKDQPPTIDVRYV